MKTDRPPGRTPTASRREFLKTSSAIAAVGTLPLARCAYAAGSDEIKLALIGCGGRGTGAAAQALRNQAMPNVRLVALADAFQDRVELSYKAIATQAKDKVDVPQERRFTGLDAYQKAIDCDVDMVLLCSPPGFRPQQFEAAVEAGRHVFMEKPVATDAPGVRRILAANEQAKQKGLLVAVGHHLRHEDKHRESIARIHDGAIGDLQYLRAYFNSGGVWVRPRRPDQSEMQHQVRNWYYFNWLSGDHIVEQHVHDLDVCNWIMQGPPAQAQGMGGRQVRIGPNYGEIYDHHAVEFTYGDGTKLFSYCRHIPKCWNSFAEHAHGTRGTVDFEGHGKVTMRVDGQEPRSWSRNHDGHQVEHDDLFAALAEGRPYNEGDYGATSTMTAILGRMASYSGQVISWEDALASEIDLCPPDLSWDGETLVKPGPDGLYPCATPGVTKVL
jgi:predicted dehydrogenase